LSSILVNLAGLGLYLALAILPGLALLKLLAGPSRDQSDDPAPWLRLGLAAGLGLALQPLVYLLASSLGLPVGAGFWWIMLSLSAAYLFWPELWAFQGWLRIDRPGPLVPSSARIKRSSALEPADLVMLALLACLLASRAWAVRGLSIPMFGDSLHHTMIVRLFGLQGGLPQNWLPFAELSSFSYHFGLHAGAASLSMLSGLPAPRALILSGQGLMLLQALTAYALAAGLTGRRWAGVGAALAAGGLGTMPAYYANWGRYTQLAGQVLLPVTLLLTIRAAGDAGDAEPARAAAGRKLADREVADRRTAGRTAAGQDSDGSDSEGGGSALAPSLDRPTGATATAFGHSDSSKLLAALPSGWRAGLLAALSVAGLALTHYIVTLLYALAVLAWLALGIRGGWRARLRPLVRLTGIAGAALILASPWIPRVLAGPLDESALKMSTGKLPDPEVYGLVSPWQVWNPDALGRNLGWWLVAALFGLGLIGLLRRERLTRIGLAWIGLILLATYPQLLGLPITGVLKDFTVAVGFYLPAALIVGGGLGALAAGIGVEPGSAPRATSPRASAPRAAWLLAGLVLALAGMRAWQDRALIDPAFQLVFPADEAAMAWIRQNTPPEARFLVSSFSAFGDTVQAGDDAGWWLPLLAEPRQGTLPPITYGIEQGFDPDYRLRVNALAEQWQSGLDRPETLAALQAAGVGHAYVGVSGKALDRAALQASPHWQQLYAQGGAEVYALRNSEPETTLSGAVESGFTKSDSAESGSAESSPASSRIRDSGSFESGRSSPSTAAETQP
jgi:hypothetical protein